MGDKKPTRLVQGERFPAEGADWQKEPAVSEMVEIRTEAIDRAMFFREEK